MNEETARTNPTDRKCKERQERPKIAENLCQRAEARKTGDRDCNTVVLKIIKRSLSVNPFHFPEILKQPIASADQRVSQLEHTCLLF
jgi:hypothetical protein